MRTNTAYTKDMPAEYARWINRELDADIFAVATLRQFVRTSDGTMVRGNRDRYDAAAQQFMSLLSKRVYGKTMWRRFKRQLPVAITLEGDGQTKLWHLNLSLRCPSHLDPERFEAHFRKEWEAFEWGMPDVYFDRRTGDCTAYSLKDGPDALLTESLSF